jgi:hypothetical protein
VSRWDALLDACHKRARPIIMTTLAMGAGMMPIALGLGAADPSFRSPMSIAVIGGLITSTVLSLLVVPVVFTYIDDLEHFIARMARRLRGRHATPGQPEAPAAEQAKEVKERGFTPKNLAPCIVLKLADLEAFHPGFCGSVIWAGLYSWVQLYISSHVKTRTAFGRNRPDWRRVNASSGRARRLQHCCGARRRFEPSP